MGLTDQATSYQVYGSKPSAIISDGALLTVPLWAVTVMSISETYHLPPIGTSGQRSAVAPHEDTISLSAVLLGKERFAWKFALETMAEASKRGTALGAIPGAPLGSGLVLITSLTIRTDMQVQSLSFTATAARRDTLDVAISLVHVPRPGWLNQALAAASVAVGALTDFSGV